MENKKIGRPKVYLAQEEPMKNYNVRLTWKHVHDAKKIGSGNVSDGIRIAIETFVLRKDKDV